MRSHWSRVDPNPMTSIFKEKGNLNTDTHTEGKAM